MKISDYSYQLPQNKIAQYPPAVRGDAKLLVLDRNSGSIRDEHYGDLCNHLGKGDVLVLNNTKVIKARLFALGEDGKHHELVLLEKHGTSADVHHHKVLYRGTLLAHERLIVGIVELRVEGIYEDGIALISSGHDLDKLADEQGNVPLPPYMKRDATARDIERYQTVFARTKGSVAAPTASLNMTQDILMKLKEKGVEVCYLTLHVGLGTFLPIRESDIKKHHMHSEWFAIPTETLECIRKAKQTGKRVTALGTTVARTLEYAADEILGTRSQTISGEADIFIYPGYEFRLVDQLLTNFHAPKSTVLMLAAAFANWEYLENAYQHALGSDYAFLSYGDSMLIV